MTDINNEDSLANAVEAYRRLPTGIGVPQIVSAFSGKVVIPLDDSEHDKELVRCIAQAATSVIELTQASPIKTTRLNELGNAVERPMLDACNREGLNATWPERSDGSSSRSGYPDIAIGIGGERPSYLEAKVIGAGKERSSFRSFYLSPSERPKVCVDARHLLVAFTHQSVGNDEYGLASYRLLSFKVVDLARVFGKIKFEYQASNKDMYLPGAIVAQG